MDAGFNPARKTKITSHGWQSDVNNFRPLAKAHQYMFEFGLFNTYHGGTDLTQKNFAHAGFQLLIDQFVLTKKSTYQSSQNMCPKWTINKNLSPYLNQ